MPTSWRSIDSLHTLWSAKSSRLRTPRARSGCAYLDALNPAASSTCFTSTAPAPEDEDEAGGAFVMVDTLWPRSSLSSPPSPPPRPPPVVPRETLALVARKRCCSMSLARTVAARPHASAASLEATTHSSRSSLEAARSKNAVPSEVRILSTTGCVMSNGAKVA